MPTRRDVLITILGLALGETKSLNAMPAVRPKSLTWAPPSLQNPSIIELDKVDLRNPLRLALDSDFILILGGRPLSVSSLRVWGGRNVRMVGGAISANQPASQSIRGLISCAGMKSMFIEGVLIDCKNQYGMDGVEFGSRGGQVDLYIQSCRIENVFSTRQGFHADAIQQYGDAGSVFMDRVTIRSQYQGLFLDPQHDIVAYDIRRLDADYTDPSAGTGYIFYLRSFEGGRRPPILLQDVYIGERAGGRWEDISIYPKSELSFGCRRSGNLITFPSFEEVKGYISLGPPSGGPWVTYNDCGVGYMSPGYL